MSAPDPQQPGGRPRLALPAPLRLWGTWTAVTLGIGFIAASMPFPARFATALIAIIAIVLASVALWHTSGQQNMGGVRGLLITGIVISTGLAVFGGSWLLVAPEIMDHEACRDAAITPTAKTQCDVDLEDAVYGKFGLPTPNDE